MKKLLAALALMAVSSFAHPAYAYNRNITEQTLKYISPIYEQYFLLQPSSTYQFSTANLTALGSCTPDTVMHIENFTTGWLASNDDCPSPYGLFSCIQYTTPPGASMLVHVVVHAYSTCSTAQGTFHATGSGITDPNATAVFGGQVLTATDDIGWSANDVQQAVTLMNGADPSDYLRFYDLTWPAGNCGTNALQLYKSWGPGSNNDLSIATPTQDSSAFCKVKVVVGSANQTDFNKTARLYTNDVNIADFDADGLGDLLESQLHTCTSVGGPNCADTVNPMDTDRDDIADGAELIGYGTSQRLPYWGASPTHKDVFVEMDWNSTSSPFAAAEATQVAAIYAAGAAASILNPDSLPGVSLHLDTGISSCDAGGQNCSTVYGNWGGATSVSTAAYTTSCTTDLSASRTGVFRHALVSPGCTGGQGAYGWCIGFSGQCYPGNVPLFAHELGHALGLSHAGSGPTLNCKANYQSLMNYAFNGSTSFSAGTRSPLVSTALNEVTGAGGSNSYLIGVFDFLLPGQSVSIDWNRNGVIDSGTVQGASRWAQTSSTGCETAMLHENKNIYTGVAGATMSALSVLGSDMHMLYRGTDNLLYWSKFTSNLIACTSPGVPAGCCSTSETSTGCGTWSTSPVVISSNTVTSSPAALSVNVSGVGQRTVVAYRRLLGINASYYLKSIDSNGTASTEKFIWQVTPKDAAPDPALALKPDGTGFYLIYVSNDDSFIHQAVIDNSLNFVSDTAITNASSGLNYQTLFSPTVSANPLQSGTVYMIWVNASNQMRMSYLSSGSQYQDVTAAFPFSATTFGRPTLFFDNQFDKGFELWSVDTLNRLVRQWMSDSFVFKHGNLVYNVWAQYHAGGASLALYNNRLQALGTCFGLGAGSADCANNSVKHAPFANGIFEIPEIDNDDFVTMRINMCVGCDPLCLPKYTACGSLPPPPEYVCTAPQ